MRTRHKSFLLTTLLLLSGSAAAQAKSPWQGEWGVFPGGNTQVGMRLSIHDCSGSTCSFSIVNRSGPEGQAGTASAEPMTIQSATQASATLAGSTQDGLCLLRFVRTDAAITVQSTGKSCSSYYGTRPSATMSGRYPRRSAENYVGMHAEQCFSNGSKALLAICTHAELNKLEEKWSELAEEYPLYPPVGKDVSSYTELTRHDEAMIRACDGDANPQQCLTDKYSADIAQMQAKKDVCLAGTTDRGDVPEGGRQALRIAGKYRNRFENGDVEGNKYKTTDTLEIRPVGAASIHFDAELNFFNGHTCSIDGGALYRKDGSFVFDDDPKNNYSDDVPACRLAIIPTGSGVKFKDITGGCKMYCGARGSLDGAEFTFKQRVSGMAAKK